MHVFNSDLSVRRKHMSKDTIGAHHSKNVCMVAWWVARRERSLSRSFGLERRTSGK